MTVIEEIDDLLDALKRHTEGMPHGLRKELFGHLEKLGPRAPLSSRTFERLAEELQEFASIADRGR